jgi:hypothetical protein
MDILFMDFFFSALLLIMNALLANTRYRNAWFYGISMKIIISLNNEHPFERNDIFFLSFLLFLPLWLLILSWGRFQLFIFSLSRVFCLRYQLFMIHDVDSTFYGSNTPITNNLLVCVKHTRCNYVHGKGEDSQVSFDFFQIF